MGRILAYGESWDLPGVPRVPNPFAEFLIDVYDLEDKSVPPNAQAKRPTSFTSPPPEAAAGSAGESPFKRIRKSLVNQGFKDQLDP